MTNLEYYKDEILKHCSLCDIAWICKYGKQCPGIHCSDCEFDNSDKKCIEVILAEHKEPVKLKQWEKDLLETHEPRYIFNNLFSLYKMKERGHFKGVTDIGMTIGEILENCEVVD